MAAYLHNIHISNVIKQINKKLLKINYAKNEKSNRYYSY